jgi:hypothetical protein
MCIGGSPALVNESAIERVKFVISQRRECVVLLSAWACSSCMKRCLSFMPNSLASSLICGS